MRTVLRACAAAMPLLVLGLGTAPAAAQTAVETVMFIALGIDTSKATDDEYFKSETASADENTLNYKLLRAKWGTALTDLTITQTEPCVFHLSGQHFRADYIVNRDATIDFRSAAATQSLREFVKWPHLKHMNTLKDYYFAIDGVKVCSKGQVFGDTFERFPEPGNCRNELQTYSFDSAAFRDRMIGAVNYLRTNFCKPRAF